MNRQEQREYWRIKQRESRARRRAKTAPVVEAPIVNRPPVLTPCRVPDIRASVSCKASMEEIAALGPERAMLFMQGVAKVISVLNPRTPVGGQIIR